MNIDVKHVTFALMTPELAVVDVQCKCNIYPVSWLIILTVSFGSVSMVTRKKNFVGTFVQNCTYCTVLESRVGT